MLYTIDKIDIDYYLDFFSALTYHGEHSSKEGPLEVKVPQNMFLQRGGEKQREKHK